MKKYFLRVLIIVCLSVASFSTPFLTGTRAYAADYDPQHTMLALNMAIVSIHKIIATQDRIVLDQEYSNIINNLSLGNIEADTDIKELYQNMMDIISRKRLRGEEARRFHERYEQQETNRLINAIAGIRAYGGNISSLLGSFAVACISSFMDYQNSRDELLATLDNDLWQLKKEDITDCNELQKKLLDASWNLLRQYRLPDEYRVVQKSLDEFYRAVSEIDASKRYRMLRAIEKEFRIYPPYWFYRGRAAQDDKNNAEAERCFNKFEEVWRPVLRQDPYKVESAKYRFCELVKNVKADKISDDIKQKALEQLKIIQNNTPTEDWSNVIFTGMAYATLGEKKRGIDCIQANVDFDYGKDTSNLFIEQLKTSKMDLSSLPTKIEALSVQRILSDAQDREFSTVLVEYFKGNEDSAKKALERMSETSSNKNIFFVLGLMEMNKQGPINYIKVNELNRQTDGNLKYGKADMLALAEYYAGRNSIPARLVLGFDALNEKKPQKLLAYLLPAAQSGNALAQSLVGTVYAMSSDFDNAKQWLIKATENGNSFGNMTLAFLYMGGRGVPKNPAKAVELFNKAADEGHWMAQFTIGKMYYDGDEDVNFKKDYKKAYMYLTLAKLCGSYGDDDAAIQKMLDKIEGKGILWDSDPKIPHKEMQEAKQEAERRFAKIKDRTAEKSGWWFW